MLAKFERFLKYVKTPPLADYSLQGELRNVRQFIRNYGATEPTEELANKIRLCTFGGSPRKVDVLDPLLANRRCKHAEKKDLP